MSWICSPPSNPGVFTFPYPLTGLLVLQVFSQLTPSFPVALPPVSPLWEDFKRLVYSGPRSPPLSLLCFLCGLLCFTWCYWFKPTNTSYICLWISCLSFLIKFKFHKIKNFVLISIKSTEPYSNTVEFLKYICWTNELSQDQVTVYTRLGQLSHFSEFSFLIYKMEMVGPELFTLWGYYEDQIKSWI